MSSLENITILLVEDDEADQEAFRRLSKRRNLPCRLLIANSGDEAIELLGRDRMNLPNLMIVDLKMPRMNGIELITKIRSEPYWKDLPIIVCSSSDEKNDQLTASALNVISYIIKKPTTETENLFDFLESYLTENKFPANIK